MLAAHQAGTRSPAVRIRSLNPRRRGPIGRTRWAITLQTTAHIQPSCNKTAIKSGAIKPTRKLSGVGRSLRSKCAAGARKKPSSVAIASAPMRNTGSRRSASRAAWAEMTAKTSPANSEMMRTMP